MKKLFILGLLCLSALGGYTQGNNKKYRPEITCTEVCGVSFGSSYESAKEILKNKYGESDYIETNETSIVYHYKTYGGINFSYMSFSFQRNGNNSYMNQCVMGIDGSTIQDAKEKRDYIGLKPKVNTHFAIGI